MDITVIILFIIICILAYVLYLYYRPTMITSGVVPLSNTNTIASSDILNQTASTYHYDLWVFVNSVRGAEFTPIFTHKDFKLGLEGTSLKIKGGDYQLIHQDNFPFQKWVFINVVVNSNIMELYLNGKLVVTHQLTNVESDKIAHTTADTITYGNGNLTGYITRFTRLAEKMSSEEAWEKYLTGNGVSAPGNTSGKYGVSLEIEKNNQPFGLYKMF